MADMLVKLYKLLDLNTSLQQVRQNGILIKRPIGPEKYFVVEWVRSRFGNHWVSEVDISFSNRPVSTFIALDEKENKIVGFASYDATVRGFFGPTGVDEDYRGKGIGTALLLSCLHDMFNVGYAYAIIGDPGPVEYYKKTVDAVEIEDSYPGIYKNMLR